MTADDWLREVQRRKVPDRLYIEGAKIIEAQQRVIDSLAARCHGQSEVLATRAEKKEGEGK